MSVITGATIENAPSQNFARAAAQRSRREHHAGLGARHQRHQPRRDRHARDRPAGAARRPQPLSGLLRLRDVGLPAGEPERGQADRSDPRAGLRGLGRQRALRRRQRDHQVAARDAGHQRDRSASAASTAPTARTPARCGTSAARTRRRSTIAGRSSSPPAAIRRIRCARPTGIDPVRSARGLRRCRARTYPPFTNTGTTQPKFDGARRLRLRGRRASCRSPAASRGTDGIMHTGIGPFDINSGTVMGYAKANYDRKGFRAAFFTNILNGDADNLLTRDPLTGSPITFDFDTKHLRLRGLERPDVRRQARGQLRRQPAVQPVRPVDRAERGQSHGVRRLRAGRDLPLEACSAGSSARGVDRFDYLDDFVFSPRTTFMIKPRAESDDPRLVQPRLPLAVGHQQLPRPVIAQPIDLGLFSPALAGRIYPLPVSIEGNPDLKEQSLDAFEIGYTGVLSEAGDRVRGVLRQQGEERHPLHARTDRSLHGAEPAAELAAAARGHRRLVAGAAACPARFTYLNFGQSTQQGFELGVNSPVNRDCQCLRQLLLAGRRRIRRTSI